MRYSNRRGEKEGNEKLFWYNQFQIATCRQTAKYSTITGSINHFVEWKDPHPFTIFDIDTEGSDSVNSQQILIQGMLNKDNLLDIVQNFTLFREDDNGKTIKIIPRYQQYRAVQKIIARLKSGRTAAERQGAPGPCRTESGHAPQGRLCRRPAAPAGDSAKPDSPSAGERRFPR